MTIQDLLSITELIAPADCVWSEDNIGLIVGRADTEVTRALVALDVSLDVISEAKAWGAQVIISHHPVIFKSVLSVTGERATGRRVMALIENGIANIALHTNYDGAENGINDELARILGLNNVETLVNCDGDYGRYGDLKEPLPLPDFAVHVRHALNISAVRAHDAGKPVRKVAVGSGGSGGILSHVLDAGCDTFVTGDIRHDVFCDARDMGVNLIDAGHFATEDIMCGLLVGELLKMAPGLEVRKATKSLAPYEVY